MRASHLILYAMLIVSAMAMVIRSSNAEENDLLPVFKGKSERLTFIIDSSDSQKALRIMAVASRMQKEGTDTTVIFDQSGVLLVTENPDLRRAEYDSRPMPQLDLSSKQLESNNANFDRNIDRKLQSQTPQKKLLVKTARQRFQQQLIKQLSYGGKALACKYCIDQYGITKSELVHSGISTNAKELAKALEGRPESQKKIRPNDDH